MSAKGPHAVRAAVALAVLLVFGAQAPGCVGRPRTERVSMGQGKMLRVNESDNGRTVKLAAGESLEISLAENPTTGYRWQRATEDAGSPCLFVKDSYESGRAELPGQGGIHRWQFQAVEPGVCKIQLEYRRSWEKDRPPERVFRIHVEVRRDAPE